MSNRTFTVQRTVTIKQSIVIDIDEARSIYGEDVDFDDEDRSHAGDMEDVTFNEQWVEVLGATSTPTTDDKETTYRVWEN